MYEQKTIKKDEAKRQIEAAIELLSNDGDLLAIYILASNAFMIAENLEEKKNKDLVTEASQDSGTLITNNPFIMGKTQKGDPGLASFAIF